MVSLLNGFALGFQIALFLCDFFFFKIFDGGEDGSILEGEEAESRYSD